uniref:PfkB family carbohydrate kinase n=1 Tax=Stappia sp. TaxID=1870903 RepID=UPI003BA94F60
MTVCCFGAIHLDTLVHASRAIRPETSTPGAFSTRPGGVATNVARGLARLGSEVLLAGALGNDPEAGVLRDWLARERIRLLEVRREDAPTGRYIALHDPDGSLPAAVVDARITDTLDAGAFCADMAAASSASLWFLDANLPEEVLDRLCTTAGSRRIAADAVSRAKAGRLRPVLPRLDMLFCNRAEAQVILGEENGARELPGTRHLATALVRAGVRACLVSDGGADLVVATADGCVGIPVPQPERIHDVTGAGDALVAGTLRAIETGLDLPSAAACGLRAAALTLASPGAVSDALCWSAIAPPTPASTAGARRSYKPGPSGARRTPANGDRT